MCDQSPMPEGVICDQCGEKQATRWLGMTSVAICGSFDCMEQAEQDFEDFCMEQQHEDRV